MYTIIFGMIFILISPVSFGCFNGLACSSAQKKTKKKYSYARLHMTSYKSAVDNKNWLLIYQKIQRFPGTVDTQFYMIYETPDVLRRASTLGTVIQHKANALGYAILCSDHGSVERLINLGASIVAPCYY